MQKTLVVLVLVLLAAAGWFLFLEKNGPSGNFASTPAANLNGNSQNFPENASNSRTQNALPDPNANPFQPPLDRAAERITKKPFGIYITPQNSPVQPEKFRGWHTGTDFEIFPEELGTDVPAHAICSGKIAAKRSASGYGGVLVQNCTLNSQLVTVIYGHLKLASIQKNTGDQLDAGEMIGILGKAYSSETDGERKHLHLGIHKGTSINILGYVQNKNELSDWLDPCELVCR